MNSEANGQSAPNTSREEGRQEQGQVSLQQQACASDGSTARERDRIIYVENASNIHKPFVLQKIATVEQLLSVFCSQFPQLCIQSIGLRVSDTRVGTFHRKYFTEIIPYEADTLYITLYLRKHDPIVV
jgi:hypothetical protein